MLAHVREVGYVLDSLEQACWVRWLEDRPYETHGLEICSYVFQPTLTAKVEVQKMSDIEAVYCA